MSLVEAERLRLARVILGQLPQMRLKVRQRFSGS